MVENKCYHPHCKECNDNKCTKYLNVKNCVSLKAKPQEWMKENNKEEYTLREVFKMSVGTKLKLFPYDENEREIIIAEGVAGNKYLYYLDSQGYQDDGVTVNSWLMDKTIFRVIQQPVSFMEVAKSNNNCKVIYEKYDIDTVYNTLDKIIKLIAQHRKECDLQELITEGKWYLEE